MLYHYADKSRDYKHCDGGDITFLVCQVNFCLKGYGDSR